MNESSDDLARLLNVSRLTHVVDVGANPIEGPTPYGPLQDRNLCRITGFEPQASAFEELNKIQRPNVIFHPYAIGDGERHTLNICHYSGWTSTFVPSAAALDVFSFFKDNARVIARTEVQTRRLDDISEIENVDFLKIDIQGGELSALVHGREKLKNAVAVQTEFQFVNLYEGQPSFWEIDREMRAQGFIPHAFASLKKWPVGPLIFGNNPTQPLNQLLEADMVYVRDFIAAQSISDEQFKHLCLIAHHCYQSFDLAGRCVGILEKRNAIRPGALQQYVAILQRK